MVVIPLLAAKSSVCWNPILYIAMNPQVRQSYITNFNNTTIIRKKCYGVFSPYDAYQSRSNNIFFCLDFEGKQEMLPQL